MSLIFLRNIFRTSVFIFLCGTFALSGDLLASTNPLKKCGLLLGYKDGTWTFKNKISYNSPKHLEDHAIDGTPILAGAATLDNFALGAMLVHDRPVIEYSRVRIEDKLELCKSGDCKVLETKIAANPDEMSTVSTLIGDEMVALSKATLVGTYSSMPDEMARLAFKPLGENQSVVNKAEAYQYIRSLGLEVGGEHQRLEKVHVHPNEPKANVWLNAKGIDFSRYANFPGLLDSLFQAGAIIRKQRNLEDTVLHIPVAIKKIIMKRVRQPSAENSIFTGQIEVTSGMTTNSLFMEMNVSMFQDGKPIVFIEGFKLIGIPKETMSGRKP